MKLGIEIIGILAAVQECIKESDDADLRFGMMDFFEALSEVQHRFPVVLESVIITHNTSGPTGTLDVKKKLVREGDDSAEE